MRSRCLSGSFQDFGLPHAIRTDNGMPFRLRPCALRSEQAVGLVAPARHPHRTHQARASRAERPARADASDAEDGSHQTRRRQCAPAASALRCLHRPLQPRAPASGAGHAGARRASTRRRRAPTAASPTWPIPFHDWTATVTHCGRICYNRRKINLSQVFAGQNVGVKQVSDRIWLVTFMDYDLGYFDDETCRLEPIENPFGPKVLPMSPE